MPESLKIRNRKEKKANEALKSLKAKGKFAKLIQEKLINVLKFIKEIDKIHEWRKKRN